MTNESAVHSFQNLKEGASKIVDRARSLSAKVGQKLDTIKTSAEDAVEETRHKIRENPLAIVGGVALGAFGIGLLTGYIIRARKQ